MVNVTDAIGFDETNFNGIYTYVSERRQYDRPVWEVPTDPDGQNLKFYDGNWIIHGIGNDILSHKANTYFPPTQDSTAQWKHSNVNGMFHVWIRCIDSYSPTTVPITESISDVNAPFPTSVDAAEVKPKQNNRNKSNNDILIVTIIAIGVLLLFCISCALIVYYMKYTTSQKLVH